MMTVRQLIEHLQQFPQDLPVAYQLHSEQTLLELNQICRWTGQPPRPDGWIHDRWSRVRDGDPQMPEQEYVLFPGN